MIELPHPMLAHRIPTPTWARPPRVDVAATFDVAEHARIQACRAELLAAVHAAVAAWLPAHSVATRAEGFPSRDRLSGEYYLGDESYWVNDEPWFEKVGRGREVRFAILVRCLEVASRPDHVERDYLGLELQLTWDAAAGTFTLDGIDASSI